MPRGVGYQTDFIAKVLGRMGAADDVTISMVDRVARAHDLPKGQTKTLIQNVSGMKGGFRNPENFNRGNFWNSLTVKGRVKSSTL